MKAFMRKLRGFAYLLCAVLAATAAGQEIRSVAPKDALGLLKDPSAHLVDVRSVAEYVLVGHPVQAHNIPLAFWLDTSAGFERNERFIDDLKSRFAPADTLIFICRSGGRSLRAAEAARAAGFANVVNVTEGFEGELDASGRRTIGGWKNAGLPWTYEVDPQLAYGSRPVTRK
jgi:rhodanese-related sulfurtransferase